METIFDINEVVKSLKKKDYTVHYFETHEEAAEYIAGRIDGKKVGFGDSKTLLGMGMVEKLKENPGNEVHHPDYAPEGMGFNDEARVCLTAEVFLSSVNAMTKDGMLVNIDSTGNRVAGTLFGPSKVFFVVGINKICDNLDEAIERARHHAAPINAKRHGYSTPCAKTGKCYDCNSPDRICNALVVHYKKMKYTDAEVVLIGEELGF